MDTYKTICVREITHPAVLKQVYRLRVQAWTETEVAPEAFPSGEWTDAYDPIARHWLVKDGNGIVGACRLTVHDALRDVPCARFYHKIEAKTAPRYGVFSRLVVLRRARRQGLSKQLDHARLTAAVESGCRTIVGYSHRPDRVRALCRKGFCRAADFKAYHEEPGGRVTPYYMSIGRGWEKTFPER
jgi:GNAT superfamily N-acetyltransferase